MSEQIYLTDTRFGTNDPGRLKLNLDEQYYVLAEDEAAFFKSWTGIQDDQALKEHILKAQADAYEVHPYPCIRRFSFTKLKISRFPAYHELLRLGKERPGALFLDIGCCFGNDVRKAVADGFPASQALASDLRPEFWELGFNLFCDDPEKFPVHFIPGDAFDPDFLAIEPPSATVLPSPVPPLTSLKTLTPLSHRLSVIHASSFFHLFDEAKQLVMARAFASLLSAEPGSVIFGAHGGRPEQGLRFEAALPPSSKTPMFCHSPESWKNLWEKEVFGEGQVKVWAILRETDRPDLAHIPETKFWLLIWSVTRL